MRTIKKTFHGNSRRYHDINGVLTLTIDSKVQPEWDTLRGTKVLTVVDAHRVAFYIHDDGSIHAVVLA